VLGMSPLAFTSGDPRWCSYRQAAARGWQVRKGEKATPVYFYKPWLYGNGRVEDLGLFRLEIHLHRGRGFRSRKSAIKAEAFRNDRGVEEGQGELVVVHGEALVRSACEREPRRMTALGLSSPRAG
jgi:N-terminal domain of anti-restriction factor ArdC